MSLDTSDTSISHVYRTLLSPAAPLDWCIFGYDRTPSKLHLYASGHQGVDQLRHNLRSNEVQYGLIKVEGRLIVLSYIPERIEGVKRARALVHSRALLNIFKAHSASISVTSPSELTLAYLRSILRLSPQPNSSLPPSASSLQTTFRNDESRFSNSTTATNPTMTTNTHDHHQQQYQHNHLDVDRDREGMSQRSPSDSVGTEQQSFVSGSTIRAGGGGTLSREESTARKGKWKAVNQDSVESDGRYVEEEEKGAEEDRPPALPEKPFPSPTPHSHSTSTDYFPQSTSTSSNVSNVHPSSTQSPRSQRYLVPNGQQQQRQHFDQTSSPRTSFDTSPRAEAQARLEGRSPNLSSTMIELPRPRIPPPSSSIHPSHSTQDSLHRGMPPLGPPVGSSPPPDDLQHSSPGGDTNQQGKKSIAIRPESEFPASARMMLTSLPQTPDRHEFDRGEIDHSRDQEGGEVEVEGEVEGGMPLRQDSSHWSPDSIRSEDEGRDLGGGRGVKRISKEGSIGGSGTVRRNLVEEMERERGEDRAKEARPEEEDEDEEGGIVDSYGRDGEGDDGVEEQEVEEERKRLEEVKLREEEEEEVTRRRREEEESAAAKEEEAERIRRREAEWERVRQQEVERKRVEEMEMERLRRIEEERIEREEEEKRQAEEAERTRRAKEEMRLMIERERLERKLREEEERRRIEEEKEKARVMKRQELQEKRDRGETMLSGEVSVQGGASMLWRRRYYELSCNTLTLSKSRADIVRPSDTLSVSSILSITRNPEEAQGIAHSFKLTVKDDDEGWLFYTDRDESKEELIEGLLIAKG